MNNTDFMQKMKVFRVKIDIDKGVAFEDLCKNEKTNVNAKLKELINSSLMGNSRYFFSGKNEIKYNKTSNDFSWFVNLDSGKNIEVLNKLSESFLISLKNEIEKAILERREWIHQRSSDSIEVPKELVGGKNEFNK
jgi:hypothetical protein